MPAGACLAARLRSCWWRRRSLLLRVAGGGRCRTAAPEPQAAASRPTAASTKSTGQPDALGDPLLVPCSSPPQLGRQQIAGGAATRPLAPRSTATLARVRRLMAIVALAPLILLVSVCVAGVPSATATVARRPLPAGRHPSPIALMVCRPKAQREINEVLGVKAKVSDRTWVDHKYSCRYGYPNGSFELSVKELSSWSQTFAYFHRLGAQLGDVQTLGNLGQGAFRTSGGDVVVRKDWKVLLVDISGLPPSSASPRPARPTWASRWPTSSWAAGTATECPVVRFRTVLAAMVRSSPIAPVSWQVGLQRDRRSDRGRERVRERHRFGLMLVGGVVKIRPRHISSVEPSPQVTKCGGTLRRRGSSCWSCGL